MFEPSEIQMLIDSPFSFKAFDKFTSFDEVEKRLNDHLNYDFINFIQRDSCELPNKCISSQLKYATCKFVCKHGVPNTLNDYSTPYTNCPAHILFNNSECGQYLIVTSVCNQHNHIIESKIQSTDTNRQSFPQQQLMPDVQEEIEYLLNANIATKKIADYVHIKTGQSLTTKDFSIIRMEAVRNRQCLENCDLDKQEAILQRIKQFIIFSSDILEKTLNEGSRVESDVESTTGSSLTSTTHEESIMWPHTSEEEIECIHDSNQMLYIPTSQSQIAPAAKPIAETSDINTYFEISLPVLNVLPDNILEHLNQAQLSIQQQQQLQPNSNYSQQSSPSDDDNIIYEDDYLIDKNQAIHSEVSPSVGSATTNLEAEIETIESDKCLSLILPTSTNTVKTAAAQSNNADDNQQQQQLYPIVNIINAKNKRKRLLTEKQTDSVLHTNKFRCRILNCSMCGVDARITKAQLDVLRAQKQKLREQIKILKLKKRALVNSAVVVRPT